MVLAFHLSTWYDSRVTENRNSQSRPMCVKCRMNRELSAGRKDYLAVHESHPAASEDRNIISFCGKRSAKEVFFYEKTDCFVYRLLQRTESCED